MDSGARDSHHDRELIGYSCEKSSKRRYTRGELFELGKLVYKDDSVKLDELEKFEKADWEQYNNNFDKTNEEDNRSGNFNFSPPVRSITNLGRQFSGLEHEFSSLNDYRSNLKLSKTNNSMAPNQQSTRYRISRMSSNPTIKYRAQPTDQEYIPIQTRTKYARLIESFNNNGKSIKIKQQQQQQLNKLTDNVTTRSNNEFCSATGQQERRVERPNYLFGPLRKEMPRVQSRRHSGECSSLPYTNLRHQTFNSNGKSNNINSKPSSTNSTNTTKCLIDDNSSSPITKIGAQPEALTEENGDLQRKVEDPAEEDDFDITSLLSITILSDIKTMKQEQLHQVNNNNSYKQLNNNYNKNKPRNHHEPIIRPLTRARTSTDFTYSDRRRSRIAEENHHNYAIATSNYYPSSESESLTSSNVQYNWLFHNQQQNFYENRVVVPEQDKQQCIDATEPVDKKVLDIIETFKAQVKARSKEQTIVSSDSRQNGEEKPKSDGRIISGLNEQKVLVKPIENSSQTFGVAKQDAITGKVGGKSQEEMIEKDSGITKENSIEQSTNKSRTSNIPRLITLLKSSKLPKPEVSKDSGSNSDAKDFKSKKIVSQYRLLRGKSLADEVNDVTSK